MSNIKHEFQNVAAMIIQKIRTKEEKNESKMCKRLISHGSNANYLHNGKLVLEESISFFHGKTNPIYYFSIDEINSMVVDCDSYVFIDAFSKWYKGVWEGRPVIVRNHDSIGNYDCGVECIIREIVVSTRMGTHQNVQKLLGCCLETNLPVLVYEWVGTETLASRLLGNKNEKNPPLEWRDRLRISWETSHAIAYLHTAFHRPIIHKDLKPATVFLDKYNNAKVFDFSLSDLIPEGKEYVQPDKIIGCLSYLAPEYRLEGRVAEGADVYAFGVLLLVLLTGKSTWSSTDEVYTNIPLVKWVREGYRKKCINEIIDPSILDGNVSNSELLYEQVGALIELAFWCMAKDEDERPTMVEIGTYIKNMMRSLETAT